MTSFGANIFSGLLQFRKIKRKIIGFDTIPPRTKKEFVPNRILNSYKTDIEIINNKTTVTFENKDHSKSDTYNLLSWWFLYI